MSLSSPSAGKNQVLRLKQHLHSKPAQVVTLDELGDEMLTNRFSSTLYGFR